MSTRQRVWLATIVIGCGHPTTPATPVRGSSAAPSTDAATSAPIRLEDDLPRLAERGVKLFLDWRVALEQSGTDCAAATSKLTVLADANRDLIEANRKVLRGSRDRIKALRAELEKHQESLDASAKAIAASPLMTQCSTDPAFAKVLDRLGGEG